MSEEIKIMDTEFEKDKRIKELETLLKEICDWMPYLNFAQYPSDDECRKLFAHRIQTALKEGK